MVLGLIDFLLGGKKKTKVPRSGQVNAPLNSVGGGNASANSDSAANIPDGQSNPTQNRGNDLQFEDSTNSNQQQGQPFKSAGAPSGKKPISEVIGKIHEELKSTNERITELVSDVKSVQNDFNSLGHRIDNLEEAKKVSEEKMSDIDENMGKFLSLYELINNQYNPFVDNDEKVRNSPKEIVLDSQGKSTEEESTSNSEPKSFEDLNLKNSASSKNEEVDDLDSSLLELDTLNIEEAAGNAVPLTNLKNNTNSLVVILSWLEYLIKKVGINETRNTLRYYTEVLRWITPEVYFDLDKYLRGMKDKKEFAGDETLNVRDHIVSLYFISKLNEKALDQKLTKAVLQIIKQ